MPLSIKLESCNLRHFAISTSVLAMASTEQQEHAVALLEPKVGEEEAYTTDGSLDIDGNPAPKHRTGGWRACRSILGTEFCQCLAYFGMTINLVTYLTTELHQSNVAAAKNVSTWQATCFLTPLAGAIVADSYWGKYHTMVVGCCIGVAGLLMASLSALLPLLIKNISTVAMASAQEFVLFLGLYMIALGVGGLRPCLMSFGADQFDAGDPSERKSKGSYFNWYLFTMNCAAVISTTGMVWLQDHYGWALGLAISAMVLAVGLSCLVAATPAYRFQRNRGSPFTRVCQVVVAAVRKFNVAPPADVALLYEVPEDASSMKGVQRIEHTDDLQFFDKAAVVTASDEEAAGDPWRLCSLTQVEELKILVRMLPLWASIAFFYTGMAQVNSMFVEQGMAMDARVGSLRVPPASLATFELLTSMALIPLYDRVFVPAARRLTGREKGIPDLLRIGGGLAMAVLAMAAAALVETKRARAAQMGMEKTSIVWQVPQYVVMGVAEMLASAGQLDFFYSQAPPAMKTVCMALGFLAVAAGVYLSSLVLTAVSWATATGGRPGWIPDDLNEGHLDRFFWMMAGLGCLNLVAFTSCALRYKSRKDFCTRAPDPAPAMASTDTEQQEHAVALLQPEVEEAYTTDGSLGVDGNPALKHRTGGWRACRPILGTEFCYCLAYYGITFNLVTYLTAELHQSNVAAANNVSTWQATCFLTPLAGAVAADSYWGRYRTMVVSCCIGVAGMLMAALSALLPLLIKDTSSMASAQEIILFLGLYMIAFGVGGLRPCLMSFGADQFDDGDTSERISKGSYFNWYIFTMNCASVISTTAMVWVQDHYGWALGLGIPAMVLAVGLSCLVAASRAYRFQTTRGSPLTRVSQVVVAAVRKLNVAPPADMALLYDLPEDASSMKGVQRIEHTADLRSVHVSRCIGYATCSIRFFDKAAVVTASDEEAARNPWRLCVVTQVEELKILVRMLPLWACVAFYYTATAQANSTFVEQGMAMDTRFGSFHIITTIVLIPLYDRAFVPAARRLTGREKGISDLLRIGGGLAMAALAMAAAALVETKRQRARAAHAGMEPTSILWQAPQYVLVGVGELLATVGQLDFFYSQAPPAMKTVCTALGFISVAAGEYLSSLVVTAVSWATATGGRPGWIPDDLNEGHLDRFFWMMAGLGCVNLVVFTSCAMRYKSRKAC
uniref:Uncharacterized protein n=1 Tax=Oryza glumipatula TaxID=40148 RepID=A0A0E0AE39_9ORYZ